MSDPRMDDAPEWAVALMEATTATHLTLTDILDKVDGIVTELTPVMDQLMNHPMLKMFLGKPKG